MDFTARMTGNAIGRFFGAELYNAVMNRFFVRVHGLGFQSGKPECIYEVRVFMAAGAEFYHFHVGTSGFLTEAVRHMNKSVADAGFFMAVHTPLQ